MPGTLEGGRKTRETNLRKYGADYYARIGKKGGEVSRGGGFTGDPERARELGRIGGKSKGKKSESSTSSTIH